MTTMRKLIKLCEHRGFLRKLETENADAAAFDKLLNFGPVGSLLQETLRNEWLHSMVTDQDTTVFLKENSFKDTFKFAKEICSEKLPFGIAEVIHKNDNIESAKVIKKNFDFDRYFEEGCSALLRTTIFVMPSDAVRFFHRWQRQRKMWWRKVSASPGRYSLSDITIDEGVNSQSVEIIADYSWGKQLLEVLELSGLLHKQLTEHDLQLLDPILCDYRAKIVRDYLNNQTIKEKFINPYKDLFSYVSEHTGSKIEDFGDILGIYFVLKCEDDYALQLPDWTKSIYPEPIQTAAGTVYAYVNSNLIANKLNSGYLLQKIINDTNDKIANKLTPPDRKLFLYSGHDTTLGYMLDTLKVLKPPHVPPYGSAIVMEIYEKLQNYYIKVSYLKHPLNPQIEELTLPGCEALCPWDEFVKMVAPVLPSVSYEELCSGGITNSSNA